MEAQLSGWVRGDEQRCRRLPGGALAGARRWSPGTPLADRATRALCEPEPGALVVDTW